MRGFAVWAVQWLTAATATSATTMWWAGRKAVRPTHKCHNARKALSLGPPNDERRFATSGRTLDYTRSLAYHYQSLSSTGS